MNIDIRFPEKLWRELHDDLSRSHPYAHERVAFLSCKPAVLPGGGLLLIASQLLPIADDDYEHDDRVGAMLRGAAFRKALQHAYNNPASVFHVHRHEHYGTPKFSKVDTSESAKFVPDFWKVRPGFPHGAIVLSKDSAHGLVWHDAAHRPAPVSRFLLVGNPLKAYTHADVQ